MPLEGGQLPAYQGGAATQHDARSEPLMPAAQG